MLKIPHSYFAIHTVFLLSLASADKRIITQTASLLLGYTSILSYPITQIKQFSMVKNVIQFMSFNVEK